MAYGYPISHFNYSVGVSVSSVRVMGKKSRTKGASYEREVCQLWKKAGITFKRNPQSAGADRQGPDIEPQIPLSFLHAESQMVKMWLAHCLWHECKRRAKQFSTPEIYKALEEASAPAGRRGLLPSVILRLDNQPSLLVIPLEELIEWRTKSSPTKES